MMHRPAAPRILIIAQHVYRALLVTYPPAFRRAYGRHMTQVFRDCCRDAQRTAGARGLVAVWRGAIVDLAITAGKERGEQMRQAITGRWRTIVLVGAALLCALVIGYLNTHTDEPTIIAPFLLLFAAALSAVRPRWAWLWALLVGLAVPLSQALALVAALRTPYPNSPTQVAESCIALIFAVAGAAVGAALGWSFSRVRNPRPPVSR